MSIKKFIAAREEQLHARKEAKALRSAAKDKIEYAKSMQSIIDAEKQNAIVQMVQDFTYLKHTSQFLMRHCSRNQNLEGSPVSDAERNWEQAAEDFNRAWSNMLSAKIKLLEYLAWNPDRINADNSPVHIDLDMNRVLGYTSDE